MNEIQGKFMVYSLFVSSAKREAELNKANLSKLKKEIDLLNLVHFCQTGKFYDDTLS